MTAIPGPPRPDGERDEGRRTGLTAAYGPPAFPARRPYDAVAGARRAADAGRSLTGQNCSILMTDIASFGDPSRDDHDRRVVRDVMYAVLWDAFDASDVPLGTCHWEDRGDGALFVIPPAVPTVSAVDPFLARVAATLRRHNRQASDAVRVQLRVALHVGPVTADPHGISGHAVNQTARLLESPVLKELMAATAADVGFIASEFVYDNVIGHAPGYVDPATYRRVEFQVKESQLTAWIQLSGERPTPAAGTARRSDPRPIAAPAIAFHESVHVEGDFVLGDKLQGFGSPDEDRRR